jgi:hypothetical protein
LDIVMDIPAQAGLTFSVHLNLQNLDELHLSASSLWVEWFPCTKQEKVDDYFEAVSGLLSGRHRILEHRRGSRVVKAELQRRRMDGWETISGCSHLLSIPWPRKTFKMVQNVTALQPR